MRTTQPRVPPNGFTLLEVMGALLLVILAGSMFFAAPRRSPARDARDTAMRMRALLMAALADAEVDGGDVIVRAEAVAAGGRSGRFLALAGPPGVTPGDDPVAEWVELERGVAWRAGGATRDPMDAPTDGRVPGTIRCSPDACATGTAAYAAYYVGHERRARLAWALVLTDDRQVLLYRWDDAAAAWRTEAA